VLPIIAAVSERSPIPAREADERRPAAVLAVYSWDLLRAIGALFGAIAPFAGGLRSGTQAVKLGLPVQITGALASASFAATLLILASLLTRRQAWVRRLQIATMATAVALAGVSLAVGYATASGIELGGLFGTLLFMLLDALTIMIMTERGVTAWYGEAATTPRYALGTYGFWALSGCALVAISATLR